MPGVVNGRWAPSAGRRVASLPLLPLLLEVRFNILEKLNLESLRDTLFAEADGEDNGEFTLGDNSTFRLDELLEFFGDEDRFPDRDSPSFDDFLRKMLKCDILPCGEGEEKGA